MRPRLAFRTHYQVDEPTYMEWLVRECTSPTQGAYREVVAERLAKEIQERRKKSFNVPAAAYGVDLARALDLITDQYRWTDKGHLYGLLDGQQPERSDRNDQLELDAERRLTHFRVFLEGDGAALLYIGRHLLTHGELTNSDRDWNLLAQSMFEALYSEYLEITQNTADRVALRNELDRIRAKGYEGKSGAHKMFVHVQTLHRLGLIERRGGSGARSYYVPEDDPDRHRSLKVFVDAIPNAHSLEQIVHGRSWAEIAAAIFVPSHNEPSAESLHSSVVRVLLLAYRRVIQTGVPLCPLTTLVDSVQAKLLVDGTLVRNSEVMDLLLKLQEQSPKQVRFHVDRAGKPAFLKVSDQLLDDVLLQAPS